MALQQAEAAERALAALAEVQDPEMPISIVDLGLIYGVEVSGGVARVRLTFTAMGCPASEYILDDVRTRLLQEPDIEAVEVEVVWDPPWSVARVSEPGRQALLAFGLGL